MMDFDAKISGAWNALWLAAHWEKKLKKADYMHANVDEVYFFGLFISVADDLFFSVEQSYVLFLFIFVGHRFPL